MANPNLFQTVRTPIIGSGGTFTYTGTAGVSAVLPSGANGAFVWTTSDAYITLGVGSTATTANWPIPSYTPVFIPNQDETGQRVRVSAIQIASGGSAYFVAVV
jgi:hypothetical protein